MSRLPNTFPELTDADGQPISGGKLFTYEAGTTNAKTSYADKDLTVPNANPVIADAAGVVGPVYLTPNEAYKFVVKDASDNTIRSEDNALSVLTSDDSATESLKQLASSPTDFGAVGDGSADESSEVQSAIDAATARGVVNFRGLTFRCDNQIVVPTGLTLENGVLNFANCTDDEYVKVHGSLGSQDALTVDSGANTATVASTASYALGDLLSLAIDDDVTGELFVVGALSGTVITANHPFYDDYTTADSAVIKKVTSLDDVTLKQLKIVGPSSGSDNGVSIINCRRARLEDVVFEGDFAASLYIGSSWETHVSSCRFLDNPTTAIKEVGASLGTRIWNCTFSGSFTDIWEPLSTALIPTDLESAKGIPRDVEIRGCEIKTYQATSAYFVFNLGTCEYVYIRDNDIRVSAAAAVDVIKVAAKNVELVGNNIRVEGVAQTSVSVIRLAFGDDTRTGRGFYVRIIGNRIWTTGIGIEAVDGGSSTTALDSVEIIDNNIFATANGPIEIVDLSATALLIHGNVCQQTSGAATARIHVKSTVRTLSLVDISCNVFDKLLVDASSGGAIEEVKTRGNSIALTYQVLNVGEHSSLGDSVESSVAINEVTTIHISALLSRGNCVITNNSSAFTSCVVSGSTFIELSFLRVTSSFPVTKSTALSITGCSFLSTTNASSVDISGYIDGFSVSGCSFDIGGSGDGVSLVGSLAGAIINGMISGNTFNNGTYGIDASNTSSVYAGVNTYISMSSGNHTGLANGDVTNNAGATDYTLDASPGTTQNNNEVLSALITELLNLGLLQ